MSNMDDLTVNCLDAITIQWINEAKSPDDFIDFSYEQVSRNVQHSKNSC